MIGSTKIQLVHGDIAAAKVDFVIDDVGPQYKGGYFGENTKLERTYQDALQRALDGGQRSVAFPSIATGPGGFAIDEAALVALNTMVRFCREHPQALDEVQIVLESEADFTAYAARFDEVVQTMLG